MEKFIAWYTTEDNRPAGHTYAEAEVFHTAADASARAYQWSNEVDGWIAGGSFRKPTRWTVKGALDNALLRAIRARDAHARRARTPFIIPILTKGGN